MRKTRYNMLIFNIWIFLKLNLLKTSIFQKRILSKLIFLINENFQNGNFDIPYVEIKTTLFSFRDSLVKT